MSSLTDYSIYELFERSDIPIFYGTAERGTQLPYLVYVEDGLDTLKADNTLYWRQESVRLEHYFRTKEKRMEAEIEATLLNDGYVFEKSEDVYIEDEHVFVIYYYV